eukprot:TRINITY_DN5343_c0_g1_i1.p1 TRINITY_DN5343_c0_g1~~TRINITY_DN5343_c0_g1_i1.p1  ORF type:complete len:779 (-),score=131.73 TRINITY_DN5343_c0_g1_i1:291-2627(-)
MKLTYGLVVKLGALLVFSSCLMFYYSEYPETNPPFQSHQNGAPQQPIRHGKANVDPQNMLPMIKRVIEKRQKQALQNANVQPDVVMNKEKNEKDESHKDPDDPYKIPTNNTDWEFPEHCFNFDNNERVCYKMSSKFRSPCFELKGKRHCLPSYVIFGFPKCGTSSLHYYINHHPNVQSPRVKETDYFSHWVDNGLTPSYYTSLFPNIQSPHNITGEATTKYGSSLVTPSRVMEMLPYARLIVLVRDPAEQVYSDYLMFVDWVKDEIKKFGKGSLPYPFDEFIRNPQFTSICWEKNGCKPDGSSWSYECTKKCRRYGEAIYVDWLKNWFSVFPKKQILVLQTEEMKKNPLAVMRKVEEHLSLPPHDYGHLFDTIVNVAENRGIYTVDGAHVLHNKSSDSQIPDWDTRQMLRKFYEPHVERLEQFLGQKFNWPKASPSLAQLPDSKNHCFNYSNKTKACYSINPRFKNPCFYLDGQKKCLPYYAIIGWPKSGTSSLYWYLNQHPNVEPCAVKETDYFEYWIDVDATPKYYTSLFPKIKSPFNITGEATTKYGPSLKTPRRMYEMLPHVRLIAMLRDPVEQLYSNYLMSQSWMAEHKYSPLAPFDEWIAEKTDTESCFAKHGCSMSNPGQWKKECTYSCPRLGEGIYVDWLEHWLSVYPKEQLLVLETEEMKKNGSALLNRVVEYLSLDPFDFGDALHHVVNVRGPQRGIYSVANETVLEQDQKDDEMKPQTREMLTRFYAPHNKRLETLLGRKLVHWSHASAATKENTPTHIAKVAGEEE